MENFCEGLDAEQRAVVSHRAGPAIVVAGPGAGKTRTLTARTAALLASGVAPEAIMLLTFTRTAAREMIRRATALDPRAQYATAGTFHSVGSRILQANSKIFAPDGADLPFTILDGDDADQLLRKHIDHVKQGAKNWPRVTTVGKVISFAANSQISIEEALQRRWPDYVDHAEAIETIAEAYAIEKLEKSLLSYDDCLIYWTALLEDEVVGPELRRRWSYVMIDEYQDTNALQSQLINALAGPDGNVMIVGDAAQAIYGFRGAQPGVMRDFHASHPTAKIFPISSNYRSTPEIVALANAIDQQIDTGFRRELRSTSGRTGPRPQIVDVHDAAGEAQAIVGAILADKEDGGEIKNHAILVRSTTAARRIEAECISRQVPFRVQGGTRIDEAAHIRDLLSVARVVQNSSHEPAWMRLLTRFPKVGDKAAGEIASHVMRFSDPFQAAAFLRQEAAARRTSLEMLAEAIEEAARDGTPAERLDRVIGVMSPLWAGIWADEWKARARDLEAVVLIAQEHSDLDSFLTAITLDGSIDRESVHSIDRPDEDPLTISTVHGAKGCEYDHVHISGLVQGSFPSMFANDPEERDEELRILFVAATRPRKTLRFYRPRFNANNQFTMQSEFEPLIALHVDQKQHVRPTELGDARIETTRRIDMKSRLLGNKGKYGKDGSQTGCEVRNQTIGG